MNNRVAANNLRKKAVVIFVIASLTFAVSAKGPAFGQEMRQKRVIAGPARKFRTPYVTQKTRIQSSSGASATINEVEPNDRPDQAQELMGNSPLVVNGSLDSSDDGGVVINFTDGSSDDLEDLYRITTTATGLAIILDGFSSDSDIYLLDSDAMNILASANTIGATGPESIDESSLPAGVYLIGVSIFDADPMGPPNTPYVLVARGRFGGGGIPTGGTVFEDGFESGKFDPAKWSTLSSDATGIIDVVFDFNGIPANHKGSFGVAMGKNVNGSFTTNALDLLLDLSAHNQVALSFWIKDNFDETNPRDGIFFSDDGGQTFTAASVYSFDPDKWADNSYGQLPPIDVDALATKNGLALTNQFVIRFQQFGNKSFNGSSSSSANGFFIDDVQVTEDIPTFATLPFSDGFETAQLSNVWRRADPTFPSSTTNDGTVLPGGFVDVVPDVNGTPAASEGTFGVAMGRRVDGNFTTNALDLHLDLSGKEQVALSFWIKDHFDVTGPQDGIWLSDDGGQTFSAASVYSFDPDKWADNSYGQLPPIDVDALATKNGLALTNQFVIRFQQFGNKSFNGSSSSSANGFFIDDVQVTEDIPTFATLPFADGFEAAQLSNVWRREDPTFPSPTTIAGTVLPGGFVEVASDVNGIPAASEGTFGVAMGRRVNGNLTTNALDLHLDLSSHEQVELSFWLKDNHDETNPQDGIWFSDNGGQSFSPAAAYKFDPSNYDEVFREISIDVDSIIAVRNDLAFTNQFVIRFQQFGNKSFNGSSSSSANGFFIDDVRVTDPTITSVESELSVIPDHFSLHQNYPNPFNPTTTISYDLTSPGLVNVTIYDVLGQVVRTLINERVSAGSHQVQWDGTGKAGQRVASGVYLYRLEANGLVKARKMLLLQ